MSTQMAPMWSAELEQAVRDALAAMPNPPTYSGVPDELDEQLWPGSGWTRMPTNLPIVAAPEGTPCAHCARTGRTLTYWPPTADGEFLCADHRGCWCDDAACCGGE